MYFCISYKEIIVNGPSYLNIIVILFEKFVLGVAGAAAVTCAASIVRKKDYRNAEGLLLACRLA